MASTSQEHVVLATPRCICQLMQGVGEALSKNAMMRGYLDTSRHCALSEAVADIWNPGALHGQSNTVGVL